MYINVKGIVFSSFILLSVLFASFATGATFYDYVWIVRK